MKLYRRIEKNLESIHDFWGFVDEMKEQYPGIEHWCNGLEFTAFIPAPDAEAAVEAWEKVKTIIRLENEPVENVVNQLRRGTTLLRQSWLCIAAGIVDVIANALAEAEGGKDEAV